VTEQSQHGRASEHALAFLPVSFSEQRNRVDHAEVQAFLFRSGNDLQKTAGIACRHDFRAGGFDMFDFSLKQFVRHFRLNEIVDTGAAAAPRGFG